MKIKTGILTFHTADNYGAVYQSYALQEYVRENISSDVEIVDFCTESHLKSYNIFRQIKQRMLVNSILNFFTLIEFRSLLKRKQKFSDFRKEFFLLSPRRYTSECDLLTHIAPYDVYISGSDQVFNPGNEYLKAYYLGFDKGGSKKVAYAPSFGINEFTPEISEKILPFVKDFDSLSCRERQGAEYLSGLLDKDIPVVLDPVFLADKQKWLRLLIKPQQKGKFIFVYDLCGGYELYKIARAISKKTGLPVVCASASTKKSYLFYKSLYNVGPREMLGFIHDAEYVVTDSFHGTALSLCMETKVVSYISQPSAASRIVSIMEVLDISDQIVTSYDTLRFDEMQFSEYMDKLAILRDDSKKYLKNAMDH